ncbi:MAG: glycosyltransferase family 4 protein [Chloroflexi bacterium]|nr:glycosyltransferase family 4 protein [Chloroflexota bacterium]
MRLLYLGSTDLPQPKARAIQIVNTCHALARAGVDITLVVGRRGCGGDVAALRPYGLTPHPRLRLVRLPVLRIPPSVPRAVLAQYTRAWQASYLAGLAALLPWLVVRQRPDVVLARDLRTARLAAGPAHALGARLAFEVHGLPSFEVARRAGRATLPASETARLRHLEDEVFARADSIVTITECARRILVGEYGIAPERVVTIPDGATLPVDAALTHTGRTALPGDSASLVSAAPLPVVGARHLPAIFYVGQLYPWKGAGLVLDVAARVPAARFVVVGGTGASDDADVAALAEGARVAGAGDRVELRGYVPYGRVPSLLREANIALLPLPDEPVARYFTSPLKLFDYLAAGVPIVASDLPSLREILHHEQNALLAAPGDADAFAAAVQRLLDDPALARRLGEQARQDATSYSWDARAARIVTALGSGAACVRTAAGSTKTHRDDSATLIGGRQ